MTADIDSILLMPKSVGDSRSALVLPDKYGGRGPIAYRTPRGWELGSSTEFPNSTAALVLAWNGRAVKSGVSWSSMFYPNETDLTHAVRRLLIKPGKKSFDYLTQKCVTLGTIIVVGVDSDSTMNWLETVRRS